VHGVAAEQPIFAIEIERVATRYNASLPLPVDYARMDYASHAPTAHFGVQPAQP
jgi:hypothetical protein